MTALEYLQLNAKPEYRIFSRSTITQIACDSDAVGTTGSYFTEVGTQVCFEKDSTHDGCIYLGLPLAIVNMDKFPIIIITGDWIEQNLFKLMLQNAEFPQTKTELIMLRISVNMILKLNCLSTMDRIAWSEWIKELYWNRKAVLHKWYCECVLPF